MGVFASVLFDICYNFNNCNNKDNISPNISINNRIDTSDIDYDVVVNVDSYNLTNNNNVYHLSTDNANYDFQVQYYYSYFAYVKYSIVSNSSLNLLMFNEYTWSQLLGTTIIGGSIKMGNNDVDIYDFYFSGLPDDLYLNIYFTSSYIINVDNDYDFTFNIGSSSKFTFDYTSVDMSFVFRQYRDRYAYDNGYNDGYSTGYNEGLDYGLANGVTDGQEIYDNAYNVGYQAGFTDGLNEDSDNMLRNALLTIFDIPIYYVSQLLNFELLGINFFGLFCGIITFSIALWLLKMVI